MYTVKVRHTELRRHMRCSFATGFWIEPPGNVSMQITTKSMHARSVASTGEMNQEATVQPNFFQFSVEA